MFIDVKRKKRHGSGSVLSELQDYNAPEYSWDKVVIGVEWWLRRRENC